MSALDQLLVAAKRRALDVKWRRGRLGRLEHGFWEVWCDGAPLYADWTPERLLIRVLRRA